MVVELGESREKTRKGLGKLLVLLAEVRSRVYNHMLYKMTGYFSLYGYARRLVSTFAL